MSCGCNHTPCSCANTCNQTPCTCGTCPNVCAEPDPCPSIPTLCDGDRRCNVWVEGADADGQGGICLLDTMEEHQVVNSLQRSQRAKDDLLRVTSNEYLRNLATTLPLLPTYNEGDQLQKESAQNTIPFYSLFRGQPPFAQ